MPWMPWMPRMPLGCGLLHMAPESVAGAAVLTFEAPVVEPSSGTLMKAAPSHRYLSWFRRFVWDWLHNAKQFGPHDTIMAITCLFECLSDFVVSEAFRMLRRACVEKIGVENLDGNWGFEEASETAGCHPNLFSLV